MLSAIHTIKPGIGSPQEIDVMVKVRKSSCIKLGIDSENSNYTSIGFCPLQRPSLIVMILLCIIILSNRGEGRGGELDPFDIFILETILHFQGRRHNNIDWG